MLDADAYDSSRDGVGGGGTIPGAGTGGKNGLPGRGGTGSTTPVGGSASGVDTTLAIAPCQQYCPGYGTQCKKRLEGKDCLATCQGELNGYGPSCQTLGINALRCLTPFFSASGGDCNAAVNRALTQCGMIVAAFDSCKKGISGTAAPSKPSNPVASCLRTRGGDNRNCSDFFTCNEGSYFTFCAPASGSMLLDCSCVRPSGQATSGFLVPDGDVCLDATVFCQ